jgi:DNA-binding transcriptional ArsR family regulator
MIQIHEIEKTMKALANKRRLAIILHLKSCDAATVGDIARKIKLSFKSTSSHLCLLAAAEILEKEQIGLSALYSLSSNLKAGAKEIIDLL